MKIGLKKKLRKKVKIGNATLYLGDSRYIMKRMPKVDTIITDPVWPECPKGMIPGSEKPFSLFNAIVDYFPKLAKRVVIHLGDSSDPRMLKKISMKMPYIRTCTLKWHLWEEGLLIHDANYAFIFGERIPGRKIPGFCKQENPGDQIIKGHPCPRSLSHVNWLVKWFSEKSVLDPFMGVGTTGVACANQGKEFIGIEIDEKYFDIACKRIKEAYKGERN